MPRRLAGSVDKVSYWNYSSANLGTVAGNGIEEDVIYYMQEPCPKQTYDSRSHGDCTCSMFPHEAALPHIPCIQDSSLYSALDLFLEANNQSTSRVMSN